MEYKDTYAGKVTFLQRALDDCKNEIWRELTTGMAACLQKANSLIDSGGSEHEARLREAMFYGKPFSMGVKGGDEVAQGEINDAEFTYANATGGKIEFGATIIHDDGHRCINITDPKPAHEFKTGDLVWIWYPPELAATTKRSGLSDCHREMSVIRDGPRTPMDGGGEPCFGLGGMQSSRYARLSEIRPVRVGDKAEAFNRNGGSFSGVVNELRNGYINVRHETSDGRVSMLQVYPNDGHRYGPAKLIERTLKVTLEVTGADFEVGRCEKCGRPAMEGKRRCYSCAPMPELETVAAAGCQWCHTQEPVVTIKEQRMCADCAGYVGRKEKAVCSGATPHLEYARGKRPDAEIPEFPVLRFGLPLFPNPMIGTFGSGSNLF